MSVTHEKFQAFINFIKSSVEALNPDSKFPKFIDEFYEIANDSYVKDTDIVINVETVMDWLDVKKKQTLKNKLVDNVNLIPNVDYIVLPYDKKNEQGYVTKADQITMNMESFKYLCMTSQTDNGKMCVRYYIKLEKLIKQFYYNRMEEMEEEIEKLKYNQSPKPYIEGGLIYIVPADDGWKVGKIGENSNSDERLGPYNTGKADDIDPPIMLKVQDAEQVEKCIKSLLLQDQYRGNGKEVYKMKLERLVEAIIKCDELIVAFKSKQTDVDKLAKIFEQFAGEEREFYISQDATKIMNMPKKLQIFLKQL